MMADATVAVQLRLPGFEGSAAAFIGEVEHGKRALEDVSVAAISAQFRDWLAQRDDIDLLAAGELLQAGARLAALKSTRLLVSPVVEMAEDDEPVGPAAIDPLPAHAGVWLSQRQGASTFAPAGPLDFVPRRVAPRPPLLLLSALGDIERRRTRRTSRVAVPAFLRLEVAVSSLIRRLKAGATISLHRLLRDRSRQDAIVHFLAVLDLVRRRQAVVSQPALFEDITVEWMEHAVGAESRAG